MNKTIWIDKNGNTCIGIKPECKKEVKEEIKEEVKPDDTTKNVKGNRRKRP